MKSLFLPYMSSFKINVQQVTVSNADGAISILRDLGRTDKASELVAYYLTNRKNDAIYSSRNLFKPVKDAEFADAIAKRLAEKSDDRPLIDVLLQIAKNSGWGASEEAKLSSCTADDFYNAFKSYRGELLTSLVQVPLTYGFKDTGDSRSCYSTLKRIAAESTVESDKGH